LGAKVQNNCEIAMREMPIMQGMPVIPEMPEMPVMLEMPEMLVINFAKVSNFGKVCTPKSDISELSEGNGEVRKRVERDFGEKRL